MKTLLLFLWTNRHALAALAIKALARKLKEEGRIEEIAQTADDQILRMDEIGRMPPAGLAPFTGDELTQHGPTVSIPTEHDTASAILKAKP